MLSQPHPLQHVRGVSLIETLVGLAVGMIVLTGAITMFSATAKYNTLTLSAAHLDQELRSAMSLLVHDVRRAGYSAIQAGQDTNRDNTVDINDMILNPFNAGIVDIRTGNFGSEATDSCITYAYNLDEEAGETVTATVTTATGTSTITIAKPPTIGACSDCTLPGSMNNSGTFSPTNLPFDNDNVEMFGFRLKDGALQMRTGLGGSANFDCNSGTWEAYTEETVEITKLHFDLTHTEVEVAQADIDDGDDECQNNMPCLCIRDVTITMTGRLEKQTDVEQTLQEQVRVRNDKFVTSFNTDDRCRD